MTKTTATPAAAVVAVEAFRSPLRDMTEALSDLVTAAEIALRLDRSQPNVHQLLNSKGAPTPIDGPALGRRGALYSWAEVEDFLARKAAKREASVQKKIDAAERAAARAEKAKAEAEAAKKALAARLEAEKAEKAEKVKAEAPAEEAPEVREDIDLDDPLFDMDIEEDEEAMIAALADMADED